MKIKLRKTDILFSKYIRKRDKFTCQRCGQVYPDGGRGLHCSHYWGRGRENTRFDPENCITLCWGCHRIWDGDGRGDYRDFMVKRLGQEGYDLLDIRAHTRKDRDDKLDEIVIKELLKEAYLNGL
jgi:hypothetical protein